MDDKSILAGVFLDEGTKMSFIDVCQTCDISEELLFEMIEHGLFTHQIIDYKDVQVEQKSLARIQAARRLQQDLDINLPGVVLVLELLDELAQIQMELTILQHHVKET